MPSKLNRIVVFASDSELAGLVKRAGNLTASNFLRHLAGFKPLKRGAPKGKKNARNRPADGLRQPLNTHGR
jgi:hypothetical protein